MNIKKILGEIKKSKKYLEWSKGHKEYILSNVFVMLEDSENIGDIQFGFCDHKGEKITSFVFDKEVKDMFEDDIFKKPESKVSKIEIEEVKIEIEEALKIANQSNEKYYPSEFATKKMLILQNIEGVIWNTTFITKSFNMINFKIDAKEGKLLKHEKKSLLQLGSNLN